MTASVDDPTGSQAGVPRIYGCKQNSVLTPALGLDLQADNGEVDGGLPECSIATQTHRADS